MATPSSDNLKEIQDIYINIPYKWGDNIKREKEVIDIISDYPWIADEIISSDTKILLDNENSSIEYKKRTNIPFCYVIERKSAANAGIANIWNMLHHMVTTGEKGWDLVSGFFKELSNKIGEDKDKNNSEADKNKEASKTEASTDKKSSNPTQNKEDAKKEFTPESSWSSTISSSISTIKKTLSELTSGGSLMDKVSPLMKDNNLRNDILMPYKYMYITKPTGKNYVFPLTNGSSSFSTVKNTWGSGSLLPGGIQTLIDGVFAATDYVSQRSKLNF